MGLNFQKLLDPKYLEFNRRVEALLSTGNSKRAQSLAAEFLNIYPQDPQAHFYMAKAFVKNEEVAKALAHATTAYQAMPRKLEYALFLGRLYLDMKLFEQAAPPIYAANKVAPADFKVRWALADFLAAIGRGKDAVENYVAALQLTATQTDKQLLSYDYARCLASLSMADEADRQFSLASANPAIAIAAIAQRAKLKKYLPDSEMATHISQKLKDSKLTADERSDLLLAIGGIHDNAKHYDEAYSHWAESRKLKSAKSAYKLGAARATEVADYYSRELLEKTKGFAHPSEKPLFIVGMPRSGTTLIEQVLDAHPACFGAGELGQMDRLDFGFQTLFPRENHIAKIIDKAKQNELRLRAEEALSLLGKLAGPAKKHVIDKTPTHYATMGVSALLFPNAKFIHTQRHPADSFISAFQNNMNEHHAFTYDQLTYVEVYLAKETLMAHWRDCFPERIFDLQYERLVAQPEETVRQVLEFLNLPWDESCMQFFNKGKMVKTFSRDQVRSPIYNSSVYRWKNYEKHLGPLFAALKAANYEYPEI
jgi:tetratricopeptide (TPR) repeat protein